MQQCTASLRSDYGGVGEKGPLSYFLFERILLATVFLGFFSFSAHTFSLVTVKKGAGCGGSLPAPPGRGVTGAWELLAEALYGTRL